MFSFVIHITQTLSYQLETSAWNDPKMTLPTTRSKIQHNIHVCYCPLVPHDKLQDILRRVTELSPDIFECYRVKGAPLYFTGGLKSQLSVGFTLRPTVFERIAILRQEHRSKWRSTLQGQVMIKYTQRTLLVFPNIRVHFRVACKGYFETRAPNGLKCYKRKSIVPQIYSDSVPESPSILRQ